MAKPGCAFHWKLPSYDADEKIVIDEVQTINIIVHKWTVIDEVQTIDINVDKRTVIMKFKPLTSMYINEVLLMKFKPLTSKYINEVLLMKFKPLTSKYIDELLLMKVKSISPPLTRCVVNFCNKKKQVQRVQKYTRNVVINWLFGKFALCLDCYTSDRFNFH